MFLFSFISEYDIDTTPSRSCITQSSKQLFSSSTSSETPSEPIEPRELESIANEITAADDSSDSDIDFPAEC